MKNLATFDCAVGQLAAARLYLSFQQTARNKPRGKEGKNEGLEKLKAMAGEGKWPKVRA